MSYLPEAYTHTTEFPQAFARDLQLQLRLIEERWRRFYPKLDYYSFNGDVTPKTTPAADAPDVVGESGGTAFDPLWGESVPSAQIGGDWVQPHTNGTAVDPDQFHPVQAVHMRVQRVAKDKALKHWGFDQVRDLIAIIPTISLDKLGITVRQGDQFIWDGTRYVVEQFETTGYWKNTNLRLYVVLNCRQYKHGS